jgi:hypothetical protein
MLDFLGFRYNSKAGLQAHDILLHKRTNDYQLFLSHLSAPPPHTAFSIFSRRGGGGGVISRYRGYFFNR